MKHYHNKLIIRVGKKFTKKKHLFFELLEKNTVKEERINLFFVQLLYNEKTLANYF